MISYRDWKESQLTVTNLQLDPNNPRIPNSGNDIPQRELLADLVEHDKVFDLAKLIIENGYYPVESLIVVKEKNKKIVIEGNRRLAALKLLNSPDAAPNEKWIRRFRALSNQIDLDSIKKVKIIIAPSREAAAPIIMSKHTRNQIESWSPIMKAKFYYNLVKQGLTIGEIEDEYSIPAKEINEGIRRYTMYLIACKLEYNDDISVIVKNPRKFPITTLERFYEKEDVANFLGIKFDDDLRIRGFINVDEFKRGYAKLVTDVAKKDVDSRRHNTKDLILDYLSNYGENKPNKRKKGQFTAETILDPKAKPKNDDKPKKARRKIKKKATPKSIINNSLSCDVNNQRINDVFNELKKLHVAKYPNSTGIMFRSLIEMSLGYYLDQTGHLDKIIDIERKKIEKENIKKMKKGQNTTKLPKSWHPSLRGMLSYVVNEDNDIRMNANLIKALNKMLSDKDNLVSIDTLNLFVHNQHFYPNEDMLRTLASQVQGLLQITLVEPNVDNGE